MCEIATLRSRSTLTKGDALTQHRRRFKRYLSLNDRLKIISDELKVEGSRTSTWSRAGRATQEGSYCGYCVQHRPMGKLAGIEVAKMTNLAADAPLIRQLSDVLLRELRLPKGPARLSPHRDVAGGVVKRGIELVVVLPKVLQ